MKLRHHVCILVAAFAMVSTSARAVDIDAEASAHKVELVKRYFRDVHLDDRMKAICDTLFPTMMAAMLKNNHNITDSQKAMLMDVGSQTMTEWFPSYIDKMALAYAQIFSDDELEASVAFYESPVGRSMMEKSALLAPIASEVSKEMMPDLKARMIKNLCARINCDAPKLGAT